MTRVKLNDTSKTLTMSNIINNIQKAVKRLSWRLGNGKFEPNQNDVDALQFIINWINNEKSELMKDNMLFAKCYVKLLMYETMYFKDVQFASEQLNRFLVETPIETIYDDFAKSLNQLEYEKFMKRHGLIMKHPALLSDEEKDFENKIIENNNEEFNKIIQEGKWTFDQVYKSLNNQITELIKLK